MQKGQQDPVTLQSLLFTFLILQQYPLNYGYYIPVNKEPTVLVSFSFPDALEEFGA